MKVSREFENGEDVVRFAIAGRLVLLTVVVDDDVTWHTEHHQ